MARQAVIEITCSRCGRVEHRPMSDKSILLGNDPPPAFLVTYDGQTTAYEDLCEVCTKIVQSHMREITKELSRLPHKRTKGSKSESGKAS